MRDPHRAARPAEVEFLAIDEVPADPDQPGQLGRPDRPDQPDQLGRRSRLRRWAQPAALAALATVAAALVVVDAGGRSTPHHDRLPPLKPVHVGRYLPWHERGIVGGGGAYIF